MIPLGHKKRHIFNNEYMPTKMIENTGECKILRRKGVEDILKWVHLDDFEGPARRFLIYGDPGTGKTMATTQVAHSAFQKNMLLGKVKNNNKDKFELTYDITC